MRLLIACEESGIVREEFRKRGHDAVSCDLLPTAIPGPHYQGDVFDIIDDGWEGMIGFPPCTYIAMCQWWRCQRDPERMKKAEDGLEFFRRLWTCKIPKVCLEQPKSMAIKVEPRRLIIHPWKFGHGEKKETWLWIRGFTPLVPTHLVCGREERIWKMAPGPNRSRDRARTYLGIAAAMAEQWG